MPYISRIWLSLEVTLPAEPLAARLPIAPAALALRLTEATLAYVQAAQLSYYPALAHIRAQGYILPEIWLWVEQIADWLDAQTRYLLRRSLAPLFSNLEVEQLQPKAYGLARIRPRQPDAQAELLRHLTLDTVQGVLRLGHISKHPPEAAILERFVQQRVRQNLLQPFAAVRISNVTVAPQP